MAYCSRREIALGGPQLDGEGNELGVLLDERAKLLLIGVLGSILLQVQCHPSATCDSLAIVVLCQLRATHRRFYASIQSFWLSQFKNNERALRKI